MSSPLYLARGAGRGGREANLQDYGGGAGQVALAEGISDLTTVGARITDAVYEMRALRALSDAATALERAAVDIDADPGVDPERYEAEYDAKLLEIRTEHGEALPRQYREAYDERLDRFSDRTRLGLVTAGRRKQIAEGEADLDWSLAELAEAEARAETPEDAALARETSVSGIASALARNVIDRAGADKRLLASRARVVGAALAKGMSEDPAALRQKLEAKDRPAPFDEMGEEERQKAILAARKAEEREARASLVAQRYEEATAKREERQAGMAAVSEAYAATGSEAGLTPDRLDGLRDAIALYSPSALGQLERIVAEGGHFPAGPPDDAYYGMLARLQADDPRAYAELPIGPNLTAGVVTALDPELLGNRRQEEIQKQRAARERAPDYTRNNHSIAAAKWDLIEDRLSDVPLFPLSLKELDKHGRARAEGIFWQRLSDAEEGYFQKHGKSAYGADFQTLLDGVILDLAAERRDPRISEEVSVPPSVSRGTSETLEGISPENVERVTGWLQEKGWPTTQREIRRLYDLSVEAGELEP